MGDWWYLVLSEFSQGCLTRYRMSRSLAGPWLAPQNDTFDGRAFYAAKTATDGRRRYVFGWNPTRAGEKDDGAWQWGGNLVVHEVLQQPDGTLAVGVPESVHQAFSQPLPVTLRAGLGDCRIAGDAVELVAPGSFACAMAGPLPKRCRLAARVAFAGGTHGCGFMLRVSEDLEQAYYIRLEPGRNRLVFDSWPRRGDLPFMAELERPITLEPGQPVDMQIYVDGSVCVVYVSGQVAMSTRLYDLKEGNWGVFASEGVAGFANVSAAIQPD